MNHSYHPSFCESSVDGLVDTKAVSFCNPLFASKKDRRVRKITPYPSSQSRSSPQAVPTRLRLQGWLFTDLAASLNDLVVLALCTVTGLEYGLSGYPDEYRVTVEAVWLLLVGLLGVRDWIEMVVFGLRPWIWSWRLLESGTTLGTAVCLVVSISTDTWLWDAWLIPIRLLCFALCLHKVRSAKFKYLTECKNSVVTNVSIGTAADKVQSLLHRLQAMPWLQLTPALATDLQWCSQVIAENRLHEPLVVLPDAAVSGTSAELLEMINQFSLYETPGAIHKGRIPNAARLRGAVQEPMSSPSDEVKLCLRDIDTCEFDVFRFKVATNNNELLALAQYLFRREDILQDLAIDAACFKLFISQVQAGYSASNLYHNATHAGDVLQTVFYFFEGCEVRQELLLGQLEKAACYIAAAVHDYEHPGLTNSYLVTTQAQLAIRYNDKSVLENHHISAAFQLTQDEKRDIFANLDPQDYCQIRELMINMVLATDSAQHFSLLSQFKAMADTSALTNSQSRAHVLCVLLHAADISNPSKPWSLCHRWAELVLNEFWMQGDKERQEGLPLSFLADRFAVNVGRSQVGFIDVVVAPLFEALKNVFPRMDANCKLIEENRKKWAEEEGKKQEP